jgi:hypothetical protein
LTPLVYGETLAVARHRRISREETNMYAAVRRYEGFDESRRDEVVAVIRDDFLARLTESGGLEAYFVVSDGDGVLTTITVCDTAEAVEASSRLAAEAIRDRNLSDALPNPPSITAGEVMVHKIAAGAAT